MGKIVLSLGIILTVSALIIGNVVDQEKINENVPVELKDSHTDDDVFAYWSAIYGKQDVHESEEPPEISGETFYFKDDDFNQFDNPDSPEAKESDADETARSLIANNSNDQEDKSSEELVTRRENDETFVNSTIEISSKKSINITEDKIEPNENTSVKPNFDFPKNITFCETCSKGVIASITENIMHLASTISRNFFDNNKTEIIDSQIEMPPVLNVSNESANYDVITERSLIKREEKIDEPLKKSLNFGFKKRRLLPGVFKKFQKTFKRRKDDTVTKTNSIVDMSINENRPNSDSSDKSLENFSTERINSKNDALIESKLLKKKAKSLDNKGNDYLNDFMQRKLSAKRSSRGLPMHHILNGDEVIAHFNL